MSLYLKYMKLSFMEQYVYKFNLFTSVLSGFLMLFIQISVWSALYGNTGTATSNLQEMIIYVLISSLIFNVTKSESGVKIGQKIEKGTIITDFTKPINFRNYIFAEDVGNNLFQLLFIWTPSFIFFLMYYNLEFNTNYLNISMFLVSLFFAVIIAFLVKFIIGLFAFWLETSWYIPFIVGAIFELFSGSTIPIWFYPSWLIKICSYLPFRFIFFEPISIFLGKYSLSQIVVLLCIQISWIIIIIFLEMIIWKRVQRKVIVNGG